MAKNNSILLIGLIGVAAFFIIKKTKPTPPPSPTNAKAWLSYFGYVGKEWLLKLTDVEINTIRDYYATPITAADFAAKKAAAMRIFERHNYKIQ